MDPWTTGSPSVVIWKGSSSINSPLKDFISAWRAYPLTFSPLTKLTWSFLPHSSLGSLTRHFLNPPWRQLSVAHSSNTPEFSNTLTAKEGATTRPIRIRMEHKIQIKITKHLQPPLIIITLRRAIENLITINKRAPNLKTITKTDNTLKRLTIKVAARIINQMILSLKLVPTLHQMIARAASPTQLPPLITDLRNQTILKFHRTITIAIAKLQK